MSFVSNKKEALYLSKIESNNSCSYSVKRLEGYNFVKPLMFVDDPCEEDALALTKYEINTLIENYKTNQGVVAASVYIKDYVGNGWTSLNENEKYEPGSLFKVPILIAYLKMNEQNPGVLDKELLFNQSFAIDKKVAYKSKTIQLGKSYKIKELLRYMIEYSDNNATALLNNNLKTDVLEKLFEDFGLQKPDVHAKNYYFTVKEYSIFMRSIYNASYLTIEDSEFAASLMSNSEFNDGIKKFIPKEVKTISKFGESGTNVEMQLHETAIVYLKNRPYLLTVMTKGKDNKSLSNLISDISKTTFSNLNNL
jgi:beta-lactamase class A